MTRLFAVLCCLMLITVSAYATEDVQGRPRLRIANREIALSSHDAESLVKKVRPYAAMSELAYRSYSGSMPKKTVNEKEVPKQRAEGWVQLEALLTQQHWEFLGHKQYRSGKESHETLESDLWMNTRIVPPQVVVAFRGTNSDGSNSDDAAYDDRNEQDLYAAVHNAELKEDVLEACQTAGPDVVLSATGHASGGAIAQQLFYLSQLWPANRVTQVTVFEPSPLAGVNDLGSEQERREAMSRLSSSVAAATTHWRFPEVMAHQYGFGTIRVNERPESYLRWLSRPTSDPGENYISALDFDFEDAGNQHSMAKLAQDLRYYPATPPVLEPKAVLPAAPVAPDLYRILNQS